MQSFGRSPSPSQPIISTKPADMTFEDEKTSKFVQISFRNLLFFFYLYFSQKDVNSESLVTNNNINDEKSNTIVDTNISESKTNINL